MAVTTLEYMLNYDIGMDTIVIIGNSTASSAGGWKVAARGYQTKYSLDSSE